MLSLSCDKSPARPGSRHTIAEGVVVGVAVGVSVGVAAAAPLRACQVWMASMSPQEAARLRIVNAILGFVIFIMFVGITVRSY